jgi:hypothetical protein
LDPGYGVRRFVEPTATGGFIIDGQMAVRSASTVA